MTSLLLLLGALLGTPSPCDEQPAATIRSLIRAGQWAAAEDVARSWLEHTSASCGAGSSPALHAADLVVESSLLSSVAEVGVLEAQAEASLVAKRDRFGPRSLELVPTLVNLADIADEKGAYEVALARAEDARRILEAQDGTDAQALAHTLEQGATALRNPARYGEARSHLERALDLRRSRLGAPGLWMTLDRLGDIDYLEGRLVSATETYRRSLGLAESDLGSDHPGLIDLLHKLSGTEGMLGSVAEARELAERALRIAETRLHPGHPELAWSLNVVGSALLGEGEYARANALRTRALAIMERRYGPDHDVCATFANNLAVGAALLGDLASAQAMIERAIGIWERTRGKDHPYTAVALDTLGEALAPNRPDAAYPVLQRALAIRERTSTPNSRDVAHGLADLSEVVERLGRREEALELATRAEVVWTRVPDAANQPDRARTLAILGRLAFAANDYAAARDWHENAAALRRATLGPRHPTVAESTADLARSQQRLGAHRAALDAALDAEGIGRDHLRLMASALAERQALEYAAVRPRGLDIALGVLGEKTATDAVDRVLDAAIRSRALVADELIARRAEGARRVDDMTRVLIDELAGARQRLATLAVRGPQGDVVAHAALLDRAERERDRAEQALAERYAVFREGLARKEVGLAAVRDALPAGSALVSFVLREFSAGAAYAAFVLDSRRRAKFLPLGPAGPIDELIGRWRGEAATGALAHAERSAEGRYRSVGEALRRAVWDPVAAQLGGAHLVLVVPDGQLGLVDFSALPGAAGSYLVEHEPVFHYVSAERDLARAMPAPSSGGLLAVGGPAFDARPLLSRATTVALRSATCRDLPSIQFEALPWAALEAVSVAALWRSGPAELLTGASASEAAVKRLAPGRRVLHLATHGFMLGGECARASLTSVAENPLLRAGLALAAANQRREADPAGEDGILTAEEVAALDLAGTEWVVLSACDTGVGEIRAGEGVLGLRRAFQIAGARTLIMSLWSVDDRTAARWMRLLYEGRVHQGLDTAHAIREASLTVLRKRRAAGLSTHPAFWAGFVAAGDWR